MGNNYINRTLAFHEIYQEEIIPIFRTYEVYRQRKALSLSIAKTTVVLTISLAYIFVLYKYLPIELLLKNPSESILLITITIYIIVKSFNFLWTLFTQNITKDFLMTLKNNCLSKILAIFGDIKWYNNKKILDELDLSASGLFPEFNQMNSDDEFKGSYNGVSFKVSETKLWYEKDTSKGNHRYNIFQGIIISFTNNKKIKNRTIITTKGDFTARNYIVFYSIFLIFPILFIVLDFQNIAAWIFFVIMTIIYYIISQIAIKKEEKLYPIKLEDPLFSQKFNIYSSDQVEARYLLTPTFMERFQNLKTVFGAKKVKCSFYNDQIMIAISTKKNLFEIGKFTKSLENPDSINEFYDELSSIYKMIEYFKLDEKTGL